MIRSESWPSRMRPFTNTFFTYAILVLFLGNLVPIGGNIIFEDLIINLMALFSAGILLPFMISFDDFFLSFTKKEYGNSKIPQLFIFGNIYDWLHTRDKEERSLRVYGNHKTTLKRIVLNLSYLMINYAVFVHYQNHYGQPHLIMALIGLVMLNCKTYPHLFAVLFLQLIFVISNDPISNSSKAFVSIPYLIVFLGFISTGAHMEKKCHEAEDFLKVKPLSRWPTNLAHILLPLILSGLISYWFVDQLKKKEISIAPSMEEMAKKMADQVISGNIPLEKIPGSHIEEVIKLLPKKVPDIQIDQKPMVIAPFEKKNYKYKKETEIIEKDIIIELPKIKREMMISKSQSQELSQLKLSSFTKEKLKALDSSYQQSISSMEKISQLMDVNSMVNGKTFSPDLINTISNEMKNINLQYSLNALNALQESQNQYFNSLDNIGNEMLQLSTRQINGNDFLPQDQDAYEELINNINSLSAQTDQMEGFLDSEKRSLSNFLVEAREEIKVARKNSTQPPREIAEKILQKKTSYQQKYENSEYGKKLEVLRIKQEVVTNRFNKINEHIESLRKMKYMEELEKQLSPPPPPENTKEILDIPKIDVINYEKIPPEIKKIIKNENKEKLIPWDKIFKTVILFSILFILSKFFKNNDKKGLKSNYSKKDFIRFTMEYNQLRKQGIPPRQEVMQSYYLIHQLLEQRHFLPVHKKAPPATILNAIWKQRSQPAEKSFGYITNTYCDVLYGNSSISSSQLKAFRKSFKNIYQMLKQGREYLGS